MNVQISLSHQQAFSLAAEFAETILHQVRERNLALAKGQRVNLFDSYKEVQAAIKTIKDRYERLSFICALAHNLKYLRSQHGIPVHGRDYIEIVKSHNSTSK